MKIRFLSLLLLLVVLLTSCSRGSTQDETSLFVSDNNVANSFLSGFNKVGFSGSITENKVKTIARNIKYIEGKSLLEDGLFFESKDLYGTGFGYGENENCISYNYQIEDSNKVEIYSVYCTKKLDGVDIPNNLIFDSTFEAALKSFSILDTFNKENDGNKRFIECFSENGEELYINLESWHGDIIDNNIDTAVATIRFSKTLSNIKIICTLGFHQGKLKFVDYTLTKTTPTDKKFSGDSIAMKFYKTSKSKSLYEADINSIIFKDGDAELTITAQSKTGKEESCSITLAGWLSGDQVIYIGEYEFIADKNKQKLVLQPKDESNFDYNTKYIACDELGIYLHQGKIRFNRSMSR